MSFRIMKANASVNFVSACFLDGFFFRRIGLFAISDRQRAERPSVKRPLVFPFCPFVPILGGSHLSDFNFAHEHRGWVRGEVFLRNSPAQTPRSQPECGRPGRAHRSRRLDPHYALSFQDATVLKVYKCMTFGKSCGQ